MQAGNLPALRERDLAEPVGDITERGARQPMSVHEHRVVATDVDRGEACERAGDPDQ